MLIYLICHTKIFFFLKFILCVYLLIVMTARNVLYLKKKDYTFNKD